MTRVRELRQARGWRRIDLAAITGLHRDTIRNVELGYHRPFGLTLRLLAQAFDVTVEELQS